MTHRLAVALLALVAADVAEAQVVPDSGRVYCASRALWLHSTRAYVGPAARLLSLDRAPGAQVFVEVLGGRYRGARDSVLADGLADCDRLEDAPPPIPPPPDRILPPDRPSPAPAPPPPHVVAAPRGEVVELPPVPDTQPVPVFRPTPVYPDTARDAGIQGRVVLRMRVGRDGRVVDAQIHHSTHPLFDAAALDAGRRWRFEPARLRGEAVEATVYLPVLFRMEEDERPRQRGRRGRGNR